MATQKKLTGGTIGKWKKAVAALNLAEDKRAPKLVELAKKDGFTVELDIAKGYLTDKPATKLTDDELSALRPIVLKHGGKAVKDAVTALAKGSGKVQKQVAKMNEDEKRALLEQLKAELGNGD